MIDSRHQVMYLSLIAFNVYAQLLLQIAGNSQLRSIRSDISTEYLTALRWPTAESAQRHWKSATSTMSSMLISSLLTLECTRRPLDLVSMLPSALDQISHMPSLSWADMQPDPPSSIGQGSSICSGTSAALVSTNLRCTIQGSSMIPNPLHATPMPTWGEKHPLAS